MRRLRFVRGSGGPPSSRPIDALSSRCLFLPVMTEAAMMPFFTPRWPNKTNKKKVFSCFSKGTKQTKGQHFVVVRVWLARYSRRRIKQTKNMWFLVSPKEAKQKNRFFFFEFWVLARVIALQRTPLLTSLYIAWKSRLRGHRENRPGCYFWSASLLAGGQLGWVRQQYPPQYTACTRRQCSPFRLESPSQHCQVYVLMYLRMYVVVLVHCPWNVGILCWKGILQWCIYS